MSKFSVLALVAAATLVGRTFALSEEAASFLLSERFDKFKNDFQKVYEPGEHAERLKHFENNMEKIASLNAKLRAAGKDAVHGITRFADMSDEEFQGMLGIDSRYTPKAQVIDSSNNLDDMNGTPTDSFNWMDEGKLTPIKDQGQCGSCWAFSAVSTIESVWAINGHELTEFSPQQVVSCDKEDGGCKGGLPGNAFDYVKKTGGLATAESYPYKSGKDGSNHMCHLFFKKSGGTISEWGYAHTPCTGYEQKPCVEDSSSIASALKKYGPLSVGLDASNFQHYTEGIFESSECSDKPRNMNHAVQLVGYNTDHIVPYWIVRNSWTKDWGEDGFIKLKMGDNACGLLNIPALIKAI